MGLSGGKKRMKGRYIAIQFKKAFTHNFKVYKKAYEDGEVKINDQTSNRCFVG